jgi:hypothetical protein
MRYLLLLFVFGLFLQLSAKAAPAMSHRKDTITIQVDSSVIDVKKFDQTELTNYSEQSAFIYDQELIVGTSMWSRFWNRFWSEVSKVLKNPVTGPAIGYLLLIAATGGIIYGILKLGKFDFQVLARRAGDMSVGYEEDEEDIHAINFEENIQNAVDQSNYRLAVRLLYLKALKNLNDEHLIIWQPEKTNQAYVGELKNEEQQSQFAVLTRKFEYIWYGAFPLEQESFQQIYRNFQQFNVKSS